MRTRNSRGNASSTLEPEETKFVPEKNHVPGNVLSEPTKLNDNSPIVIDSTTSGHHDVTESTKHMGASVQELVKTVQKLERLGTGKLTYPLPTIVAIGDQSAGKSSTIENISETKLPKSTGTCTRCPFQITLQSSEVSIKSWKISLSKTHYYNPSNSVTTDGKLADFHPWQETGEDKPQIVEFATVDNPEDLEEILKRAQLATLNPGTDPRAFLEGTFKPTTMEVEFSPNKICIEVSGPSLPSLTFIDLPGVISQTADGKQSNLPKLVKNLVRKHIMPKDVIILLACSMEGDISNSNASQIVRKMGAEERCIGVLTKPDRIQGKDKDTVETWRGVLNGEIFALGHSYFVTKQPSPKKDYGHNYSAMRESERKFFLEKEPWCEGAQLYAFRERFGVESLQMNLSLKLGELIRRSLPDINNRIHERLHQIETELYTIPEIPPAQATHTVWESIRSLTSRIKDDIAGADPKGQFVLEWKKTLSSFKDSVIDAIPRMSLSAERDKRMEDQVYILTTKVLVNLDSDDEYQRNNGGSPVKKRKKAESSDRSAESLGIIFSLDRIASHLDRYPSTGIPNEVDTRAKEELIRQTLNWDPPVYEFLKATDLVIYNTIVFALHDVLKPHMNTALYQETLDHCKDFVETLIEGQKSYITHELQLERYKPLISDDGLWNSQYKIELERYQTARFENRKKTYLKYFQQKTGQQKGPGKEEAVKADEICHQEPYGTEVDVMSKVCAYYKIACMRFIDNITKSVQADVFARLQSNELRELLTNKLGIVGENGKYSIFDLTTSQELTTCSPRQLYKTSSL